MSDKHNPYFRHDFQDQGSKKIKRIASVIYVCIIAFIMAGTYLHQQRDIDQGEEQIEAFNLP
jgi:hypothetical protein